MMKFIMFFIFYFFIINKLNKKMMFLYLQNSVIFNFFILLIIYPFNNMMKWMFIYYNYMMDVYSWSLIMLSFWIFLLMIMSSLKILSSSFYKLYIYLLNLLLILLIMCFLSINMIMFYLYFESSLLPIFLLILGWGYQVDRIQASFYLMLYTLFGSMPLFMVIMYLYNLKETMNFNMIFLFNNNFYLYLSMILAFLMKMPMYFVHLWLPKAHVEAPIMGSMILAGVMLKLGGYGLLRIMPIMLKMSMNFNKYFILISLLGGLISSLICLCQVDMKILVAYSSVVHMSIMMSGLMTLFSWGFLGGILMMIAHGLCSSGLFCLVNISYERLMSRSLYINKGMINYFPSLSLLWFLLCSTNLSFPPSLNLLGEILLLNSLLIWSKILMLLIMMISFFSASYTLYLYSYSQHGKFNNLNFLFSMISMLEFILLLLHWLPLNLMFLMLNYF